MEILDNFLYILIEGEPESPEVPFIRRVIDNLINKELLSTIDYKVVEIGGSGNFNSIGKLIYPKSKLHQSIPIIAISDRDFRTQEEINKMTSKPDSDFLKKNSKSVKIIYWSRHEWENFLLEDTETIANLLNQIPIKTSQFKPYRSNITNNVTKAELDKWLIQYFQNLIMEEFLECLRFRFRHNLWLSLDKPKSLFLPDMEVWFKNQIVNKARESRKNIFRLKSMFTDTVQEKFWQSYINDPSKFDFQQAKIFFRGKEAVEHLRTEAIKHLSIENLGEPSFKELILRELDNNTNSLIVQELGLMLKPYFQQAANMIMKLHK
ncbi:hypothetical protein [Anabaena sp. UHCC 0451]|uniref:hypothetical protein n=1 Tax=Anabaena sp. UHCC 0451 TaxID=2055235 RepID=UPI002B214566|nr:hypothetical protein [Anabaena sp. UHCC 0451]MEA5576760.1 hypothetical protein [Anabaena sp. UHCC 0451]